MYSIMNVGFSFDGQLLSFPRHKEFHNLFFKPVSNIKEICETHLKDNYELEIIDVYQQVFLAK